MAGSGFKTFVNGTGLPASDLNNYLMQQTVMRFASATARDAAITSPSEGMVAYLDDVNQVTNYLGSAWYPIAGQMPYYEASKTVDQSINNTAETKITYPSVATNRGGFTVASDVITLPVSGIYTINASIYWAANATGYRLTRIYVNGTMLANEGFHSTSTAATSSKAVFTGYLASGTTIEIRGIQNSGGALAASATLSRLTINYVGN